MAGASELNRFLENAEKYMSLYLPSDLPKRIPPASVPPSELQLKGHCPVTLSEKQGHAKLLFGVLKHFRSLHEYVVVGDLSLLVQYRGATYALASEEKLAKFMKYTKSLYFSKFIEHLGNSWHYYLVNYQPDRQL